MRAAQLFLLRTAALWKNHTAAALAQGSLPRRAALRLRIGALIFSPDGYLLLLEVSAVLLVH